MTEEARPNPLLSGTPSQPPPRVEAAIDVGTNSVKLIVVELQGGEARRLYETAAITRLGEGMQAQSMRLREAAMRRTLDALAVMVTDARAYGAQQIVAVGTAALRDAENRDELLRRAHERCNLNIEVLAGEEEARLSFLAVRLDPHWRDSTGLVVIDIGGGSTEVIYGQRHGDGVQSRVSVNLGAVRITERYLKSDPPTISQLAEANQAIVTALMQVEVSLLDGPYTVVCVGGTAANLAGMDLGLEQSREDRGREEAHGHRLTADRLEQMIQRLSVSTIQQRRELPGLDPNRADIILGGALLLSQALARIGSAEVAVSLRGLRWGLLYDRFLPRG
jgi:exopolyphosphatase/guanosine-5'-triphosphate,3'-diphosphate pyrophosphatase